MYRKKVQQRCILLTAVETEQRSDSRESGGLAGAKWKEKKRNDPSLCNKCINW